MTTMNEVVSFLLGEGELDGCAFGEKQPWHKGNFWWRTHLQQAHLAAQSKVPDGWRDNAAQLLRQKYGMETINSLMAVDDLKTMLANRREG